MCERPPDIWGYCQSCRRWFACPRWFDKRVGQPLCPACLSEPSAIENRAPVMDRSSEREATGARPGDLPMTADTRWRPSYPSRRKATS